MEHGKLSQRAADTGNVMYIDNKAPLILRVEIVDGWETASARVELPWMRGFPSAVQHHSRSRPAVPRFPRPIGSACYMSMYAEILGAATMFSCSYMQGPSESSNRIEQTTDSSMKKKELSNDYCISQAPS